MSASNLIVRQSLAVDDKAERDSHTTDQEATAQGPRPDTSRSGIMRAMEWLSVAVALLALVAAVWAMVELRRMKRNAQHRDAVSQQEGRRRQANEVMAWMSAELGKPSDRSSVIEVHNRSGAPIYDLVVISSDLVYRDQRRVRVDNPRLAVRIFPPGHLIYGLDPEHAWDAGRRPDEYERLRPVTMSPDRRVTAFEFTDASGTRWRRYEDGVLEEVAPGPDG